MALISILAFVIVAAIAALAKHRSLDPAGAGATIVKVKQYSTAAVEGFTFLSRLMGAFDGAKRTGARFGQTAASLAPAEGPEDE